MDKKEPVFVDGVIFQDPHEKAPAWVKFELVINPEKFTEFMKNNMEYTTPKGWMKIVAKESKKGGIYFELDTYKPTQKTEQPPKEDTETTVYKDEDGVEQEIPF